MAQGELVTNEDTPWIKTGRWWVVKQDQWNLQGRAVFRRKREARRLAKALAKAEPGGRFGVWEFHP
ncbi:MAG: hypothetical protein KGL39_29930 [Patescibacteria group bacterium]|nr:hypothetical protein [Patescibacteria group bacterium]